MNYISYEEWLKRNGMKKGKNKFKVVLALPTYQEVIVEADAFDDAGDHLEFLNLDGNDQDSVALFHEGSWLYFVRMP